MDTPGLSWILLSRHSLVCLVFVSSLPALTQSGAVDTDAVLVRCPDTKEGAHVVMGPCLRMGEKFLKRYIKRQGRGNYNMCEDYYDFQSCIGGLLGKCPVVAMHIPEEWMSTIQLFACACDDQHSNHADCLESLSCLTDEIEGVFAKNCYDKFEFNVEQGVLERCDFYPEYVHCKEKLVASRCGGQAGTLHFLAHQISARDECDIRRLHNNRGMEYSADCPANLAEQIESCAVSSLTTNDAVLSFMADNDLIADGDSASARQACSAYRKYNTCLEEWRDRCAVGVAIALQQNNQLRTYLLKMDYICNQHDYVENIECYHDVLEENMLSQCNHIWGRIEPLLSITAYHYYCTNGSQEVHDLQSELDELTSCYRDVIESKCGSLAATAMGGLISKAFQDPYYMRFEFVPDCQLHQKLYHKKEQQHRRKEEKQHHFRHHSEEKQLKNGDSDTRGENTREESKGESNRNSQQRTQVKTQTVVHSPNSAFSFHKGYFSTITAFITLFVTVLKNTNVSL